jgi:hypothetical protein
MCGNLRWVAADVTCLHTRGADQRQVCYGNEADATRPSVRNCPAPRETVEVVQLHAITDADSG